MALDKTCTASQLVARLQALIAQHGDLQVYARDADTQSRLPIGLMFREAQPEEERPARFEVTTDYNRRPRAYGNAIVPQVAAYFVMANAI